MDLSRLGPFALEEPLGEGQMYRAIHVELRKSVALRVFPAPFVRTSSPARTEFSQEFDVLKKLRHTNVVRCYGGGFEDMYGYLAYELIPGETLRDVLLRRGTLPWESVVEFALQVTAGLEHAHELQIVHQDLRLEKLLVSQHDGQVRIADFRRDRRATAKYDRAVQKTLDSVSYLAPEQIQNGVITHRTDLYALGCGMFEMLTGRPPFISDDPDELVRLQLTKKPPRVATLVLDCPIWLDALVGQLLKKDSNARPYSARTVIMALEETQRKVAAGTSVTEHAMSGLSPIKTGVDKEEVRRVLGHKAPRKKSGEAFYERAWFLTACLLLVLGSAAALLFWPESERKLFARAQRQLEDGNLVDAEFNFERLLTRFPDGSYAKSAREQLESIEMELTERQIKNRRRLGREPQSEAERLFQDAGEYENFGDRLTAREKYEAMIQLLEPTDENRPFINLARRQIAQIKEESRTSDRITFVLAQLKQADELSSNGELVAAREIWDSICKLYRGHRELEPLVAKAEASLGHRSPIATASAGSGDSEPKPTDVDPVVERPTQATQNSPHVDTATPDSVHQVEDGAEDEVHDQAPN